MDRKNDKNITLRIYITIACISILQALQFGPSPVLKQIGDHFPEVNTSLVKMLVTGPSLIGMFCALACGVMVTKISKKNLLLICGAGAAVTGLIPLAVDNFYVLFACRLIYGFVLGFATALNTAVVAEWFEGEARVKAMGFQGATVGAAMALTTAGAGFLGSSVFSNSYLINLLAVVSFVLILICLPETGKAVPTEGNKVSINVRVLLIGLLGLLEYIFLISFSTNISMHLSGSLAGNASVSGNLTSIFSMIQIVLGLVLGYITRITKKATISVAMISFGIGALVLVAFPGSFPMLCVGALLCGFSQGVFMPTAMVEAANAVPPIAAAMASGVLTCGTCIGQLISPVLLDSVSKAVYGETTTKGVYTVAAIAAFASAAFAAFVMFGNKKKS